MQVQLDCYKCIFNQIVEMAKESSGDDSERREILRKFVAMVLEHAETSTPPEMASAFYSVYCEKTGIMDPYANAKHKSTVLARQLFNEFADTINNSDDPFEAAVRIAIGGNVIDFGANPEFKLSDTADAIRETAALPIDENVLKNMFQDAAQAENILYILDNCGEAVLDRLLIEQLGKEKVTIGVRGMPILNDITRNELADSNLDDLPVIDTGDNAPGVSLRHSSEKFLDFMKNADMVIAKGQGNFESLGDSEVGKNIYYLFRVKCPVIQMQTGAELGSLQIRRGLLYKNT